MFSCCLGSCRPKDRSSLVLTNLLKIHHVTYLLYCSPAHSKASFCASGLLTGMALLFTSSLGPSALSTIGNAASVKRKESSRSSAQSKEKKKKKSALDEIMEV